MNIIDKVKDIFSTKQGGLTQHISGWLGKETMPQRGNQELLKLYSRSPWLKAVTNKIAYHTSSVQWKLYVGRDGQGRPVQNAKIKRAGFQQRQKLVKEARDDEELEEITDHPFLDTLDNMNPQLVGLQGRQITQIYMDLIGQVYWLKERNSQGMPINLWPINPEWVHRNPKYDGVRIDMPGGWSGTVPLEDLVFFNDPDPTNPYGIASGYANALDDEIATDEMAAKHTKNFFYNSARPELLIYGDMQKSDADRLKEDWKNKLQGFKKAYTPYFMPSGDRLNVQDLSQSFQDMEIVELRKFERDNIIQIFGIPPEILGVIENSNRATIDAADTIMAKYVVVPRLELQRQIMQERLIPDYDENLILDYENPVPEDKEYKQQIMSQHEWAFTQNEIRQAAGEQPLEDGDVFNIPINSVITDQQQQEPQAQEESFKTKKKVTKVDESLVEEIGELIKREQLEEEVIQRYQIILAEVGQETLDSLDMGIDFNLEHPYVSDYIDNRVGQRIKNINETTRSQLEETLREGITEGESIPDLANRVSDTFEVAKGRRAKTIARTETMTSVNRATFAGYEQTQGLVQKKEWIATQDDRVRDHHLDMDGQTKSLKAMFDSGLGNSTEHPGAFGVAEEDINCRCTIAPITRHDDGSRYAEPERRKQYWKTMDAKAGGYQRAMNAAYTKGFQAQQNAVMELLKSYRND